MKFLHQLTIWAKVSEQMSQEEVNTTKYNDLKAVFIEQLQQEWAHLPAEYVKKYHTYFIFKKKTTSTYK